MPNRDGPTMAGDREDVRNPGTPPAREDHRTPGDQDRPMTADEELDNALDETFPGSDPIAPRRIDGPRT